MTSTRDSHRIRRLASTGALALAAVGFVLACHSGSPAAPEGTTLYTSCRFVQGTQDFATGDFEAQVGVLLLDSESNVPQTGVGVYYIVSSGDASFAIPSPVRTDNGGHVVNTLSATGHTAGNKVKVKVFSGPASADLEIDVASCASTGNAPPRVSFTVTPANPTTSQDVRVNVSGSTDDGCGTGTQTAPRFWTIDWDDGTIQEDLPFSDPEEQHRYATAGTYTIKVTVEDCGGQSATETRNITVT